MTNIDYASGANLYAYTDNDPLNHIDSAGLISDFTADAYAKSVMSMTPKQRLGLAAGGGISLGIGLGCVVACPAILGLGGEAAVGGEAVVGGAGTTTATVATTPTFTATIGNTALDLTADPLAGTTRGILIPSQTPGLVGSEITDFSTSIPSATTNLGKAITIIGGGLELRNNLNEPAK